MARHSERGSYARRVMLCERCGVGYSHRGPPSRLCFDCRKPDGKVPRRAPDEWYEQAARWVGGETLEAIAAEEGLTREAVRQRIATILPKRTIAALKEARKAENPSRRVARFVTCSVCGIEIRRRSGPLDAEWALCSTHSRFRSQLMTHCDEERHAKHRVLALGHEPTYASAAWRTRRANGNVRGLVRGSGMHALVVQARAEGWPLWDRLPAEIRDWVDRRSGD